MIKRALLLLIFLALAIVLGQQLIKGAGYVLIVLPDGLTSIEMSFWVAGLLVVLGFFALYWLLQIFGWIQNPFKGIQKRRQKHKTQKSASSTLKGLLDLSQGKWNKARKRLLSAAKNSSTPLVNYLGAAQAAHYENKPELVENLLQTALKSTPQASISVDFLQAKMQLSQGQYEQALATLVRLHNQVPQHPVVLNLLKETHLQLNDWQPLIQLLPSLHKQQAISNQDFQNLETQVYLGYYQNLSRNQQAQTSFTKLKNIWEKHSPNLKLNPEIVFSWLQYVLQQQEFVYAEQLLSKTLKQVWSPQLIQAYGLLPANIEVKRRLLTAEKWLKDRPADAVLLHSLARICQQQGLWRKALEYFQASYQLEANKRLCLELAHLYQALGEANHADFYKQQALQIAYKELPQLPLP